MLELRIHGFGGQGAVTLAHLLAQTALNNGSQSQALPSFGVERRGSPVKAAVRIADNEIRIFSQSIAPDMLIAMDRQLVERAVGEGVKAEGIMLVNSPVPVSTGHTTYLVDATGIAVEEGLVSNDGPFINIPLLGAAASVIGIPFAVLEDTLRARFKAAVADKNVQVAKRAYDGVVKVEGAT